MQIRTILIVEDDRDTLFVYATILERVGYTVVQAVNGQEGVRCAREFHPDLILMDLAMPILDGWGAVEQLKADPLTASIPVFVISAYVGRDWDTQRAHAAGFERCLCKPTTPKALLQAVQDRVGPPSEPHSRPAYA